MGAIKDAKLVGYANHLDWDSDLLNSKYSHLQTFIDNKIEVVQTDYSDLVNSYLKEKGLLKQSQGTNVVDLEEYNMTL